MPEKWIPASPAFHDGSFQAHAPKPPLLSLETCPTADGAQPRSHIRIAGPAPAHGVQDHKFGSREATGIETPVRASSVPGDSNRLLSAPWRSREHPTAALA